MKKIALFLISILIPLNSYSEELSIICRGLDKSTVGEPRETQINLVINLQDNIILHHNSLLNSFNSISDDGIYSVELEIDDFYFNIFEDYKVISTGAVLSSFMQISRHDGRATRKSYILYENKLTQDNSFIGTCQRQENRRF